MSDQELHIKESGLVGQTEAVTPNDGELSDDLMCRWRSWRVIGPRLLAVDLPPRNCTDMFGAIRVAQALMPDVRQIQVFCDGAPDILYSHHGGRWQAIPV